MYFEYHPESSKHVPATYFNLGLKVYKWDLLSAIGSPRASVHQTFVGRLSQALVRGPRASHSSRLSGSKPTAAQTPAATSVITTAPADASSVCIRFVPARDCALAGRARSVASVPRPPAKGCQPGGSRCESLSGQPRKAERGHKLNISYTSKWGWQRSSAYRLASVRGMCSRVAGVA